MKIKWHKPIVNRGKPPINELLKIAIELLVKHGVYKNKNTAYTCLRRFKRIKKNKNG